MKTMESNFKRIPLRAEWWNYSRNAAYFITICTQNRIKHFGEIKEGTMHLSNTGVIAHVLWQELPYHHPSVKLGEFIIMPNHLHGILILDSENNAVDQGHALELPPPSSRFQNIGKNSVFSILCSYKSAVTKYANRLGFPHGWQPRFHDHIIRDEFEYQRIENYIRNNVKGG